MEHYKINTEIDIWDAENTFYLASHPNRISKFIAHYELYKKIAGLSGAIVECGVYKGASLMRFCAFRNALENDFGRKIYGFDMFGKFPTNDVKSENDIQFIKDFEENGGYGISQPDLEAMIAKKGFQNVSCIAGNVTETIPTYLEENPHLRIALLHLDMDVYEPTKFALDHFAPRLVPGGLIVIDDYNAVEGATIATDEFCKKHGKRIQKLPFNNTPSFIEI